MTREKEITDLREITKRHSHTSDPLNDPPRQAFVNGQWNGEIAMANRCLKIIDSLEAENKELKKELKETDMSQENTWSMLKECEKVICERNIEIQELKDRLEIAENEIKSLSKSVYKRDSLIVELRNKISGVKNDK
jgi:chromosome segregation ATPase